MTAQPRQAGSARSATGPSLPARLLPALAIVLGLVLVATAAVTATRQPATVGADQARQLAAAAPAEAETPAVRDAAPPVAGEHQPPVEVDIAALGVQAGVDPVGVDPESGELVVPDDASRLGWYQFGPGLGAAAGSIAIAGHVDDADGPGALYQLGSLEPGDEIVVTGADGDTQTFQVVAREVYDKAEIPLARYFAHDGSPRLTLITCGGPFDRDNRHYRDNIVVTAVPAS